jgi:hypothetical protein
VTEKGEKMSQDYFRSSRRPSVSGEYRLVRTLIRFFFTLLYGKMRAPGADDLPQSAPVILVVTHPPGFLDALFLVAVARRPIHYLLDRKHVAGAWRPFLARRLGMILYQREGESERQALQAACNVLGNLGAVAVFAEPSEIDQPSHFALFPATIALESESRNANQLDLHVVPVHLFIPTANFQPRELLAYFDRRIPSQTYMLPGKALEERRPALCAALEEACRKNVFRLQPEDVRHFLADLEEVLLADLREDFSMRSRWKQKVEDFELSGFVREWVEQLNCLHPVRLVALRALESAYREELRQASLERLEIETAGGWIQSGARRALGWAETVAGSPLALFGLVNHLLPALTLRIAGIWKKQNEINRAALWISRGAVILLFYIAQVLLTDHFLGRAVAGYYALSLPISGLYLWRYAWLLRHRSRLLFLHARAPRRAARARERRQEFVRQLNAARDAYIEALELAH